MVIKRLNVGSWRISLLLLLLFTGSCSVQSRLNGRFKGKPFTEVVAAMGAPTQVENLVGGGTIRTYEKKKMLRPAPINTGTFQYDKFESPKVLQTIRTQFTVDLSGKVTAIEYSNEYSR